MTKQTTHQSLLPVTPRQQQQLLAAMAAAVAVVRWQHWQEVRRQGVTCFQQWHSWQIGCQTCSRCVCVWGGGGYVVLDSVLAVGVQRGGGHRHNHHCHVRFECLVSLMHPGGVADARSPFYAPPPSNSLCVVLFPTPCGNTGQHSPGQPSVWRFVS